MGDGFSYTMISAKNRPKILCFNIIANQVFFLPFNFVFQYFIAFNLLRINIQISCKRYVCQSHDVITSLFYIAKNMGSNKDIFSN